MAQIILNEGAAASTPASGTVSIYAKADGLVYSKDDAGLESGLGVVLPLSTTNGGTNLTSYTTGDIIYASATNVLSKLPIGSNGEVLTVAAGIPDWAAGGGSGTVTSVSVVTANGVSGSVATATTTPAITLSLGAITPTTVNGNTITTGTGVLTLAAGKTLTASNSITLAGTDSTTMTFPPASASVGYLNIPQNSQSAAYTTVAADSGKHILHPSADTTARTWTIDSNANVPYAIGTAITFINQNAGGVITIAITSDTMRLAGPGTTGNRTLAANGIATAIKITSTEWIISGTGLT